MDLLLCPKGDVLRAPGEELLDLERCHLAPETWRDSVLMTGPADGIAFLLRESTS